MTVELGPLTYQADGVTLTGWLADGSGGKPAPGVIVAHEAPGLGPGLADNVRAAARRLAARRYVALVSDMYGAEIAFAQAMEKHTELMETPSLMLARARAALDALAAHPNVDQNRMAAMGFCQGGIVSLELARAGAPVKAAIGFHPGFLRPAGSLDEPISAKILMMIGNDDPVIPAEHRAAFAHEMKAKGADWQLVTFGGVGHCYTSQGIDALGMPGFGYNATAEARAWAMALGLLDEIF
jgi:dienelactone hydrolase